ncbi:hypothetical protein R3P38DRAFT_3181502 [Favolaschia claudopus]|uniref:Thioester reductase (TE) domain-containing protein n=1 Tax=Favolaschia claudopus TaxID=2862362 RepID=A0AAW0CJ79_9AGAR
MSETTKTNFLLTGATGYIGGSILARFLAHPHADAFQFTVLVRDPKKAENFKDLGGRSRGWLTLGFSAPGETRE